MKPAYQRVPTQLEGEVHKSKLRKLAARRAVDTKRRRYKETSEWINPLGEEFHG